MCNSIESDTDYIGFAYIGDDPAALPPPTRLNKSLPPGGWKLHIAIDDSEREEFDYVARAWDLIISILIEHRICESKVIKPCISFMKDELQIGKQITIYQFLNPNRDWLVIINQIETSLNKGDQYGPIKSGLISPTDKTINGSKYISYRNDLSQDRTRSVSAKEVMRYLKEAEKSPHIKLYNPFGRPDVFENIAIFPLEDGLFAKPRTF